jgi:two-component system, OmpR family, alkaline phosphatase synthesis response regulator PhoP
MSKKVAVVEDEAELASLIEYNLSRGGFQVNLLNGAGPTLQELETWQPDLIVLDVMLPGQDGFDLCRQIRQTGKLARTPIIFLTARSDEVDRVLGLEIGGDDYITKPFSPRVLVARIRSVLRRKPEGAPEKDEIVRIHELTIDPGRHEAQVAGTAMQLTFTEFRLLHFLAQKPGWAFTRSQIVDAVKGEDYPVTERSVDVQVTGLRRKLGDYGTYIETVRGVGYRFKK